MSNVIPLNVRAHEPSARDLMQHALEPHVLLGMPHLTPFGLSETWLMKELGHRHWLLLAISLGMDNADFRTADGREVYAAICATSLTDARLDLARANDILTIRSQLAQVSRSQYASCHHLILRGQSIGQVELISTFVHRRVDGDNYSLARVDQRLSATDRLTGSALAERAAAFRRGILQAHSGPKLRDAIDAKELVYTPSVLENFNGAGLFYFAQFQAFFSRALETWLPGKFATVTQREVFFSGNIQPGEGLRIALVVHERLTNHVVCEIRRSGGSIIGVMIAHA